MTESLTVPEKQVLLRFARASMEAAVRGEPAPPVEAGALTPALHRTGTCFVTLHQHGELRGCIGGLQAQLPLDEDVRLHAKQAALQDFRFTPVTPEELPNIELEISVLSEPQRLHYDSPESLPQLLRPGVDGVILAQGQRRATFLPQVWERIADPEVFLSMLCEKMGVHPDTWRRRKLEVQTYQVEEFSEAEFTQA